MQIDDTNLPILITENFDNIVITGLGDLIDNNPADNYYFLVIDVQPTASGSSDPITPTIIANGDATTGLLDVTLTSGSVATNTPLLTNVPGSPLNELRGRTYGFDDINPPVIVNRIPAIGEQIFDPLASIVIEFNEVTNVIQTPAPLPDSTIQIHLRSDNSLVATYKVTGVSVDKKTYTYGPVNPVTDVLQSDTRYYILIGAGLYEDEALNDYQGISSTTEWTFKTADTTPPVFDMVGDDLPPAIINEIDIGFDVQFAMDEPGIVYFLLVDPTLGNPAPTALEIRNNTYGFPSVAHSTLDVFQGAQYHFKSFFDPNIPVGLNTTAFRVYMAAEDVVPNLQADGDILILDGTLGAPYGGVTVISNPAAIPGEICLGESQVILAPIQIIEGNNNDNATGTNFIFNLLLSDGFSFNTSSSNNTIEGFGDITVNSADYLNSTLLQIDYDVNATTNRDKLLISGIEVLANDSDGTKGGIVRFGGTGFSTIMDLDTLSKFEITEIDSIRFTTDILKTTIGTELNSVRLIPDPANPLGEDGTNVFSGPGVVGENFFPNAAGIGLHTLSMTHTDETGCSVTSTQLFTVFDSDNAIATLENAYCTDEIQTHLEGDTGPFLISRLGKAPDFLLVDLDVDAPDDAVLFEVPGDDVTPSLTKITSDPVIGRINSWYFDPTFFHVQTVVDAKGQEGGLVGNLVFTGVYQNQKDLTLFDTLEQTVAVYIPPANSIEIITPTGDNFGGPFGGLTGQDPAAVQIELCEDEGLVSLDGLPKPASGVATGFFAISIPSVFLNDSTGFAGLQENNDGSASLNTQAFADGFGFGEFDIKYIFETTVSACNDTIAKTMRINPKPVADFAFGQKCEGLPVQFTDISGYDPTDSVTVIASVNNAIFPNIVAWQWDFDDENSTAGNPNTSTDQNPMHTFSLAQTYNVSLTITTEFGCTDVIIIPVVVGGNPAVTMGFDGVSSNDTFRFSSSPSTVATNSVFQTFDYDYGDGNMFTSTSLNDTVTHTYATAGTYDVTVTVTANTDPLTDATPSAVGCSTPLTQTIVVLPDVAPTDANNYFEDFEGNNGGWVTLPGSGSASSWEWGTPGVKNAIVADPNVTGTNVWITSLDNSYNALERSYLYSPAFDLSNLSRPMITLDNWTRLPSSDGVVLQYSVDGLNITDPDKEWISAPDGGTLGTTSSGIEWYDLSAIAGKPGEQATNDYGWSIIDDGWRESKHTLVNVSGTAKVVLRFALGSANQTPTNDGFAFDNVRLGNRTRIVLVENFTNTQNTDSKIENDFIAGFNSGDTEMVLVNYHTNSPGADPFNLDNISGNTARALFYNLSSVPRARLDGSPAPDGATSQLFKDWGPDEFSKRSLNLAKFNIVTTIDASAGDELSISASLTALENLSANTVVHVVVVEDSIDISDLSNNQQALVTNGETSWSNVMKKMLPSAAGTKFPAAILSGETVTVNASWRLTNVYDATRGLSVVVFAQNEDAATRGEREVYQASITSVTGALVTSLEDRLSSEGILVYPSPANESFTVGFKSQLSEDVNLRVFDIFGKVIMSQVVPKGSVNAIVDSQDLKAGLYMVQIDHENSIVARERIIIVH